MVVTVIDGSELNDYAFKNVKQNAYGIFTSDQLSETSNIFGYVAWINNNANTLFDIFSAYHGKMLAHSNVNIMSTPRDELPKELNSFYVVTGYYEV